MTTPDNTNGSNPVRYAIVSTDQAATVAAYLPGNYRVVEVQERGTLIAGRDSCGWTMDDYVIPRLASGLYACRELGAGERLELSR